MKTIIIAFLCFSALIGRAQDLSRLSDEGYGHWITATRLSEKASSIDDFLLVANEYEKVLLSDPSFSDTYLKLVQLYEKIGEEKGISFLDRANDILDKYSAINPNDKRRIESERIYISAIKDKFNSGPNKFVGRWGSGNSQERDLIIKYEGGEYIITMLNMLVDRIEKESDTSFIIVKKAENYNHREELRRKGWVKYIGYCSEYEADSGFPTSGQFYYNESRMQTYYQLSLDGDAPLFSLIKFKEWFYLDGTLTFAGFSAPLGLKFGNNIQMKRK